MMISYIRLIKAFIRRSFLQEMAFRVNFFINLMNTLLNLAGGVGGAAILFSQVSKFNGWTFAQILALQGIYMLIQSLKDLVIGPSLNSLAGMDGEIWYGRFDFTLTKPVPTQFYVSVRNWMPWALVDLALSLIVIGVALARLNFVFDPVRIALFSLALLISMVIVYSVLLLLISGAFWIMGIPLIWIYDSLIQMGRFPVGIYPGVIRVILTWVIPVGFMITMPAESLVGAVNIMVMAGGGGLAVLLFGAATLFFRASIRKYSSASS
jgi:ABC-2 type transport system permease protein